MNKKRLLILLIVVPLLVVLACALIFGLGLVAGFGADRAVTKTAASFMSALAQGDQASAYSLCSAALQDELGEPADLAELIAAGQAVPIEWSFSSHSITDQRADLQGTVTLQGDRDGYAHLLLVETDRGWQISGFDIYEK